MELVDPSKPKGIPDTTIILSPLDAKSNSLIFSIDFDKHSSNSPSLINKALIPQIKFSRLLTELSGVAAIIAIFGLSRAILIAVLPVLVKPKINLALIFSDKSTVA